MNKNLHPASSSPFTLFQCQSELDLIESLIELAQAGPNDSEKENWHPHFGNVTLAENQKRSKKNASGLEDQNFGGEIPFSLSCSSGRRGASNPVGASPPGQNEPSGENHHEKKKNRQPFQDITEATLGTSKRSEETPKDSRSSVRGPKAHKIELPKGFSKIR